MTIVYLGVGFVTGALLVFAVTSHTIRQLHRDARRLVRRAEAMARMIDALVSVGLTPPPSDRLERHLSLVDGERP